MAFNRKLSLSVGANGKGYDVSTLDMTFNVDRSITVSENQGVFQIYNASERTRKEVLKDGNNIIFKAGYEDQAYGVIFSGTIVQATSVYDGIDWVTNILAYSSRAIRDVVKKMPLTLSFAPGTTMGTVLTTVGSSLDLVVNGAENANIQMLNGFAFAGLSGAFFRTMDKLLSLYRIGLFIDNNEIVIYKLDGSSAFSAVVLNEKSGLISANDVTEGALLQAIKKTKTRSATRGAKSDDIIRKKVAFTTILDPNLRPNGLVDIYGQNVTGVYLVERTRFYGDNFGGDFNCDGIGTL